MPTVFHLNFISCLSVHEAALAHVLRFPFVLGNPLFAGFQSEVELFPHVVFTRQYSVDHCLRLPPVLDKQSPSQCLRQAKLLRHVYYSFRLNLADLRTFYHLILTVVLQLCLCAEYSLLVSQRHERWIPH